MQPGFMHFDLTNIREWECSFFQMAKDNWSDGVSAKLIFIKAL